MARGQARENLILKAHSLSTNGFLKETTMPSISGHEPEAEEKAKNKKNKRQKRGNRKLNLSEAEKGPRQFQFLKPSKKAWGGGWIQKCPNWLTTLQYIFYLHEQIKLQSEHRSDLSVYI